MVCAQVATVLFIIGAGLCKALADACAHGKVRFTSQWFSVDSWRNKWRDGDAAKGERFPLSSTLLVWTTDAWHFANMLQLWCWLLALACYEPVLFWLWDVLILHVVFTASFHAGYYWIFAKKKIAHPLY
ncbi:hypothetical protein [Nibribacter koreensis]|uniref:Uncharacterized protein n=1 Tax=Nibribacter koreensis TaxID=1084519 RepID=A0ABP8FAZ0_9BACT